ncbi:MAG: ATP-binding protein [bacterium]|nr:ATP-binding protein [bacterium]
MSNSKRILLVEDNPDDVFIVKRILSKAEEEFELEVAITGKEAIEKFSNGNFDCLVLDYKLPDTNALELLKNLSKIRPGIPSILLTGLKDERLLTGALKLGVVNFLTKDEISSDILSQTILNALSSKQKSQFLEQRKEHIYEGLMDSMGQGLFALDVNDNIVLTNQRLAEILNYQEFELLGKSVFNLINEKDVETFRNEYSKVKSGNRANFEMSLISKMKEKIPVFINQTPLFDNNGVFNGSLSLVADMTNLKEMEKRLREAERLTMMTQIASETAHEIRNPLTVIKGGLYLLKTTLPKEKDIDEQILRIDKAVDRVNAHMDDLLNLSKPPLLKLRTANINDLIEESLVEVPPEILSNIEIVKELKDEQVNVDRERLKRVFINLVKNASESMPGKGKLRIAVQRVQIEKKEFISITFEDTGHGIPEEELEKIFDPFYTTKTKGTGLGLVICKRIIDAHQGNLEIQTKVGVGTTFTVQLPFFTS